MLGIDSTLKLNNSIEMPVFGIGSYKLDGEKAYSPIREALEAGYRLIDTASMYGNEEEVGRAIKDSGIDRDDLFITTKLWNDRHGYSEAILSLQESLQRLEVDYVDLFLIHWPIGGKRLDTWNAMQYLLDEGLCRAIGVSNFMIKHLDGLAKKSPAIPSVDQVEFNPFLYRKNLLDYCRSNGIQLEAYSPLARGKKLEDPKLLKMSKRYSKSPAQVLIRWALQKDLVVIPKASSRERIRENADVFDFQICHDDIKEMDSWNEGFRTTTWDPEKVR